MLTYLIIYFQVFAEQDADKQEKEVLMYCLILLGIGVAGFIGFFLQVIIPQMEGGRGLYYIHLVHPSVCLLFVHLSNFSHLPNNKMTSNLVSSLVMMSCKV